MTDPNALLKPFIARREKNLAYFKDHFPGIYKHFVNYKMQKAKLNLLPDKGEVDILDDGLSLYDGQAIAYARQEIDKFVEVYHEGSTIVSVDAPFPGDYCFKRFFTMRADEAVRKSPVNKQNFQFYKLGNFYPCITFLGCGAGYHIEAFLQTHRVNYAIIYEDNLDYFAASLYAVDWAEICSQFSAKEGRTIHFLLGGTDNEYNQWAMVWNNLVANPPAFPMATLFYNHRGLDKNDRLSEKVCDDLYVFLMSWGNYDDEINQLNSAAHNIYRGVKMLPAPTDGHKRVPVCIVGAGPSLDDRVEDLRKLQAQGAIIVSCGSAITSLHPKGIRPDIHIELESDYLYVMGQLQRLEDPDYLKSIHFIGPVHLTPPVFELFADARAYIKNESGLATMFAGEGEIIAGGTPTCTNFGFAWAMHYGFEDVYLFGMDFGFVDRTKHHAADSIYYDEDAHDVFKDSVDYDSQHVFEVPGVNDQRVLTSPPYFSAMRKVENVILDYPRFKRIFNCSNGAHISGTTWVSEVDANQYAQGEDNKNKVLETLFAEDARSIPVKLLEARRDRLDQVMAEFQSHMIRTLSEPVGDYDELNRLCNRINTYVEDVIQGESKDFYFLMRGTVRHFLYVGFSHAFAIFDEPARRQFIDDWRQIFLSFVHDVRDHYRRVMYKHFDMDADPWIRRNIRDTDAFE